MTRIFSNTVALMAALLITTACFAQEAASSTGRCRNRKSTISTISDSTATRVCAGISRSCSKTRWPRSTPG